MVALLLLLVMVAIVVESGGANGGGGIREHCGFVIDRQHMCDTRPSKYTRTNHHIYNLLQRQRRSSHMGGVE